MGIPSDFRYDFGDYVEETKWGLPKNYTYTFKELMELAEAFKREWGIK